MRLVICDGIQYDADNLPAHVNAERCVPADEWFAQNRVTRPTPNSKPTEPAPAPDGDTTSQGKRRNRRTSN